MLAFSVMMVVYSYISLRQECEEEGSAKMLGWVLFYVSCMLAESSLHEVWPGGDFVSAGTPRNGARMQLLSTSLAASGGSYLSRVLQI